MHKSIKTGKVYNVLTVYRFDSTIIILYRGETFEEENLCGSVELIEHFMDSRLQKSILLVGGLGYG